MMKKQNDIPDKSPFRIPENYFDEVNRKIISVTSGHSSDVQKRGLSNRFRTYFLVAASFAALILLSYTALKMISPERLNRDETEVLYEKYSEMYINDFDVLTLEESAASLDLFQDLPEVNNTDIIDYLLLENIEINDIYDQL